jgi:hypothetical protein
VGVVRGVGVVRVRGRGACAWAWCVYIDCRLSIVDYRLQITD